MAKYCVECSHSILIPPDIPYDAILDNAVYCSTHYPREKHLDLRKPIPWLLGKGQFDLPSDSELLKVGEIQRELYVYDTFKQKRALITEDGIVHHATLGYLGEVVITNHHMKRVLL